MEKREGGAGIWNGLNEQLRKDYVLENSVQNAYLIRHSMEYFLTLYSCSADYG